MALQNTSLIPNHALRNSIEEWLEKNFRVVRQADVVVGRRIGAGSSKAVFEGTLRGRPVAVLQMRPGGGSCDAECSVLVRLGRHPCLVQFLGMLSHPSSGGNGDDQKQLMLTELAPHGSLIGLLHERGDEVRQCHAYAHAYATLGF